jgi:hypothetical protein
MNALTCDNESHRRILGLTIRAIAQVAMTDRATYDRHQARFVDV